MYETEEISCYIVTEPAIARSDYYEESITDAVAYYKFDEDSGTFVADSSGSGNDGSVTSGAVAWGQPAITPHVREGNTAALFSGDTVQIPRSVQDDFSLEAWVQYTDSQRNAGGHWYHGAGLIDAEVSGNTNDFGLTLRGTTATFGTGNGDVSISGGTNLNDGRPHHIVATRTKATGALELWVDGVLVATGTGNTASLTAPSKIHIGSIQSASGNALTNVVVDEVAIWDRVLTADEIIKHNNFKNTVLSIEPQWIYISSGHFFTQPAFINAEDPVVEVGNITMSGTGGGAWTGTVDVPVNAEAGDMLFVFVAATGMNSNGTGWNNSNNTLPTFFRWNESNLTSDSRSNAEYIIFYKTIDGTETSQTLTLNDCYDPHVTYLLVRGVNPDYPFISINRYNSTTTNTPSWPAITTAEWPEAFVFSYAVQNSQDDANPPVITPPASYTELTSGNTNRLGTSLSYRYAYKGQPITAENGSTAASDPVTVVSFALLPEYYTDDSTPHVRNWSHHAHGFGSPATNAVLTIPPETQPGDIIYVVHHNRSSGTYTFPAGFTLIHSGSGESNAAERVYYKRAEEGDAGSTIAITGPSSFNHVTTLIVIGGKGVVLNTDSLAGSSSFVAGYSAASRPPGLELIVGLMNTNNNNIVPQEEPSGGVHNKLYGSEDQATWTSRLGYSVNTYADSHAAGRAAQGFTYTNDNAAVHSVTFWTQQFISSSVNCFMLCADSEPIEGSLPAFIEGVELATEITDSQEIFIYGNEPFVDAQDTFIHGNQPTTDSADAYVHSTTSISATPKNVFFHGLGVAKIGRYRDIILSDNPVRYYELDEPSGTTLNDSSGNNGHATVISGSVGWGQAPLAPGSEFSALFDGDTATLANPLTTDFSIEFWVQKTGTWRNDGGHWYKGNGLIDAEIFGNTNDFGVSGKGNSIAFGVGGSDTTITTNVAVNDGKPHHIVVTRNNTTGRMEIWVDGVLDVFGTGPTGARGPSTISIGNILTGEGGPTANTYLDEIALYDYVLEQDAIERHFQGATAGTDEITPQYLFIQSENAFAVSQPAYIHIETPVELTQQAYIVAGVLMPADPQDAYIYGHETATAFQPAFIQIETPLTDSVGAFIVGPPIEASQDAYIAGIYLERVTQPAYIHIETPITPSQPAFINGDEDLGAAPKRGYLRGHGVSVDSQPAFVQIITIVQLTQPAYVHAPTILEPTQDAFIRGIEEAEPFKRAYMFGHFVAPPSAISAYIRVNEARTDFQPAFIQIENQLNVDPQSCFIQGIDELDIQPLGLYIDSRFVAEIDPRPSYVHIETPIADSQPAFVQIETRITDLQRAFITSAGHVNNPIQLCFIDSATKIESSVGCFIQIQSSDEPEPQPCYITNITFSEGFVPCFVVETNILSKPQTCYLNGHWIGGIDATVRVWMRGETPHNNFHHTFLIYMNGADGLTISDSQLCFIPSRGLIADWRLDDGSFDPGTNIINDYSGVDNDGILVNWPEWVGEPFREDCE